LRKRIYRNYLGLVFISVITLTVLLSLFFYSAFKTRAFEDVQESAEIIASLINHRMALADDDLNESEMLEFIGENTAALRVTVIAEDGQVLFDNQVLAANLDNHSDRNEVIEALAYGHGEEIRFSNTQLTETYYYTIRLENGSVLRLSKTMNSVVAVFFSLLPMVALVTLIILFLANLFARRLTTNIIEPLESIDLESDNLAVYDELIPYAKRIDQQKQRINEQLATLKNRADTITVITNSMREGLILLDARGVILTANKSALAIFEVSESDAEQAEILYICRDIDFQKSVSECLSGVHNEMVWEKNSRVYNIFFSPVSSTESIVGGVILFFDITAQRGAEQQRREFTANVSHELKTPLTAISALSEMISTGMADGADVQDFASKISEQAARLIAIIDGIIQLSEFDEGQVKPDLSEFDLHELAVLVIDALQAQADAKGITIHLNGQRMLITANRQLIDELLSNLIDNAIKYNKDAGEVSVSFNKTDGLIQIRVQDNGIGIPAKHLGRVFERFYRVDSSRSKKTGGTGLGLSIVKHIVEQHGGWVEIESSPGIGTTVTCYIVG